MIVRKITMGCRFEYEKIFYNKISISLAHFKFEISSLIFTIFVYFIHKTHVETFGKNSLLKVSLH